MTKRIEGLENKRFGRLLCLYRKDGGWLCRCDCGAVVMQAAHHLTSGKVKSCGCLKKDLFRDRFKTHGLAVKSGERTRLNRIWKQMRQRCLNPNASAFGRYGGSGITVCDEWQDFEAFHKWAMSNGYKETLEIDRIDNSLGYCPANCRWATPKEQSNNRRNNHLLYHRGVTRTMSEWANELGFTRGTINSRINILKWPTAKALSTPARRKRNAERN